MTQTARRQASGVDTAQRHRLARSGLVTPTGALTSRDGVIGLAVGTATGMTRPVAAGRAYIQGDATGTQGGYEYFNDGNPAVTVTFANGGSQARVDLVVVRVRQNDVDGSGATDAAVFIVQGPAGVTTAPAVPPSCLPLWEQPVPANASSGSGGLPAGTDRRPPPPIATGGTVPVADATDRDTLLAYPGLEVYRLDTKQRERFTIINSVGKWLPVGGRLLGPTFGAAAQTVGTAFVAMGTITIPDLADAATLHVQLTGIPNANSLAPRIDWGITDPRVAATVADHYAPGAPVSGSAARWDHAFPVEPGAQSGSLAVRMAIGGSLTQARMLYWLQG